MKNRTVNFSAIFLFVFLIVQPSLFAYNLRQITNKDNLSNSAIISLCQDRRGRVWIGTCDGLNMYNGRTVSVYQPDSREKMLSGSLIDKITETEDGILWVQTYYGLNRYDQQTGRVDHFDIFDKLLFTEKDRQNNFYIVKGNNEIYYFIGKDKEYKKIHVPGLVYADIVDFHIDEKDRIWIFTNKGYSLCYTMMRASDGSIALKKETGFKHDKNLMYCFSDDDVFFVDVDYNLYRFDLEAKKSTFIHNLQKHAGWQDEIASVVKFHDDYFVGYKTNGLFMLKKNAEGYSFEKVPVNCGIFSIIKDRYQDMLWIGTDGQGVYSYSNNTYSLTSTIFNDYTLKIGRPVRALFLDRDNTMWIGSKGDGILKIYNYDINKNILDCRLENLSTSNSQLGDNSVYAFSKSKKNILWIGTENGLDYYSYSQKQIRKVTLADKGISIKYIHNIYEQDSILWIATVGMGIVKASVKWVGDTPNLHVEKRFLINNGDMSSNYFFSIYPENEKTIWVANRGSGVFKINTETSEIEAITFDRELGNQTLNDIYAITKGRDNTYYIGTGLGFIEYYSYNNYKIMNKTNGFPNNIIHSILSESDGPMWLSTNRGLINYDPDKKTYRTYDYSDGLSIVEFSDDACFKDEATGTLFFGGINGFVSVRKHDYQPQEYMPPVYFDQLTIFGNDYNINEFLSRDKGTLSLDYSQNFFSVSFTAVDHLNGNNYTYYYRLDGQNSQWVNNGNSNTISFTDFNPGKYTLQVKYYNRVLDKESPIYSIDIDVAPPWYQSSLAYFIYFLLFMLCVGLFIRWFVIRNRRKRLRVIRQMEQFHKEEVYESKLRFFTNIAHELCTPLTLIYGPCNRILNHKSVDKHVVRYTQIIQQNAERLNSLIQDLIEFRRIETGHKKPKIEQLEMSEVLDHIVESFIDVAESNVVRLETEIPPTLLWNSDKNFITIIVTNLLSNAFKYTTERGCVRVVAKEEGGQLHIIISNTGKGINSEDISKLFDRYSILDNIEKQDSSYLWSRNGLGLAISSSLINLLDGTIDVESIPDEWTYFKLQLPQQAVSDSMIVDRDVYKVEKLKPEKNILLELPQYEGNEAKPTMLIIDDEIEMLWFISDIFTEEFNVMAINDSEEAEKILQETHPDIILCDIMMPGLDGIAFARHLKSNSKTAHIPLVIVSAKQEVEEQIEGINAGAELYVTKPFNVDYLKTAIKQLISRKETLKDYFSSPLSAFELSSGKLTHKEHKKLIKNILDIINKNIRSKDLSADFIAAKMNMSSRNLYRKVKEVSDTSIADMIRDSRLYIAEDMLVKSRLTIDEIIFKSGFANRVSFFKAFSKKYGCTPKEYRDQHSSLSI